MKVKRIGSIDHDFGCDHYYRLAPEDGEGQQQVLAAFNQGSAFPHNGPGTPFLQSTRVFPDGDTGHFIGVACVRYDV